MKHKWHKNKKDKRGMGQGGKKVKRRGKRVKKQRKRIKKNQIFIYNNQKI